MNKVNLIKTLVVLSSFALIVPLMSVNAANPVNIYMYDNSFSPQTITVARGTTVTWINYGNNANTVTSNNGLFNSGTLIPGASYSLSLNTPGTYSYYSNMTGQTMSGTITVSDDNNDSNSTTDTLVGTVESGPAIVVNQITAVKTTASADGTYQNGWKWVFDVTVPANETTLMMKFSNWIKSGGSGTIPVSNNMRFYSTQSSNAYSQATAITVNSANTYSSGMYLTGDLDSASNTRRVQITVEIKIPVGTTAGSYSTSYGIKTQ